MNILILSKNCRKYVSGYYHHDINLAFMKRGNCYLYGERYPGYNLKDTIDDVISKSPFSKNNIDLIVVGTFWENQDEDIEESDPHPNINLKKLDIPKVFFLNKEYKKLEQKLEYAKENRFDLVCTVLHNYKDWAEQTGLNFIQLPFSVNLDRFNDFKLPKRYDFGFTGALHKNYTDIRLRIKKKLFKDFVRSNPKLLCNEFKKYNIFWSEWKAKNILRRFSSLSRTKYPKFLNSFKVFLSTPGPINIIGTRYFECMATKTLLLCPESKYYNDLFKNRYNCLTFKKDLSDLKEKLDYILLNDSERNRITENAYQDVINNHNYDKRIEKVLRILKFV